jgi:hypothetical protein
MFMRWQTALRGCLFALVGAMVVSPVWAATPGELRREAEQLRAEALFHESLGLNEDRARLLKEAELKSPGSAPIKWAQGLVQHQGRWVSIDDIPKLMNHSAALARYEKKRIDFADTAEGQYELAEYCTKHNLEEQARAHLVRALEHNPSHVEARRALGFVVVNQRWIHQDDVALAARAAAETRENFDKWQKRVRDLQHDLTARAKAQRAAAAQRLAKIDDPTALPALETLLGYDQPEVALRAIETIGKMTDTAASQALARIAVNANFVNVRAEAGKLLKGRPFEQYVPTMLAALSSPIEARTNVATGANGEVVHQQVLIREGQEQNEVLLRATEYRRQYVAGGNKQYAVWQAGLDMALQNASAASRVALENMTTLERNQRIGVALASGTEQQIGSDPKDWWTWWNKYNDLKTESEKPVVVVVALRSIEVPDGDGSGSGSGGGPFGSGSGPTPSRSGGGRECLVAGTPVQTSRGRVAIERVQVGDMVLAQNVETGELAYKPVLKTTITPLGPLMRVESGDKDAMRCTAGHVFWVSGEGWRQARELRSGAQLHTPRGVITVSQVQTDTPEQTYNLVVADFHTYFAGERSLLCHDNTLRQPTQAIVPGVSVK